MKCTNSYSTSASAKLFESDVRLVATLEQMPIDVQRDLGLRMSHLQILALLDQLARVIMSGTRAARAPLTVRIVILAVIR
jgi:hypothetical protein